MDTHELVPHLQFRRATEWDPEDPQLQLINGTFSELVYSVPINVHTWIAVDKIHVDPDIDSMAQKRAMQMLKARREAFGEQYEIKSNKIHFIAENEMQLNALKNIRAF